MLSDKDGFMQHVDKCSWWGEEVLNNLGNYAKRIWYHVRPSQYVKMAAIGPNRREISLKNQPLLQLNTCHPVGTLQKWQTQRRFTISGCNKGNRLVLNRQSYRNYFETGETMLSLDQLSKHGRLDPRVGISVPAWSVSLWLLWRVRFYFCDGIGEAKTNAQIRGDNFKVKFVWYH